MKRIVFLFAVGMIALAAWADDIPALVVMTSEGERTQIDITKLRSLKFNDGNMIIYGKDDSRKTVNVDDVARMTFSSITAAIESVRTDDSVITVYDLSGKKVFRGRNTDSLQQTDLKGIFIISYQGTSRKVLIK